jgi:hypothetical protein
MGYKNRFWVVLTMLALMAVSLSAQSTSASISGNVKDEEGTYLPRIEVVATNIKTNAVTTTTTGKKGTFRFPSLAPGFYQVSIDLEGYQSYVAAGIQLNAEQSFTLRIKLKKKE